MAIDGRVPDPAAFEGPRAEQIGRALDYMGLAPGQRIEDARIDRVFIGSCTNSRIEDLRAAADIARGRHVADHVRAMVVPGSGLVKDQAESEGLDVVFREAGFDWREPGCSMCLGMNPDRLAPGERCASTSNRNFEGRQGRGGRTQLGAGAIGAGIGLIATSAWLISRASQRPAESSLAIAIVAVQFFGLSRGLFRYGQRLVGHDAAFRALADLRVSSYARLEPLAPAGLPAFRSGDLLARLVHDIDSLQDLLLRVIGPFADRAAGRGRNGGAGVVDPAGGGGDPAGGAAAGRDGADLADGRLVPALGIQAGGDPGRAHGGRRGPDRGGSRADRLRRARTRSYERTSRSTPD